MGADYNEMIAKLQAGLAQSQNQGPSLYGLQAQQDPNVMAGLLNKLQQQQYVANQGNQQGDWADQFANAGRKDFARAGQNIAQVLGVGQPQSMDNSNVMAQRQAILQGKQQLSEGLSQPGADQSQIQLQVLSKLAQAGVPGAADALAKASDDANKQATTRAQAYKDTNQGDEAKARIANMKTEQDHRSFEEGGQTWNFVSEKDGVQLYKNANGEPKVVTVQPSKTLPAAPINPDALAGAARDVANYKIPENQIYGRGMSADQKASFHDMVTAQNPDYDQRNFKQSNDAIKAYGPAGTLGQQTLKLQNAINHLGLLDQYGKALDSGDVKLANSLANKLSGEFGGTAISGYSAIAPIVASEVSSALVKGGGGVEERAEKARELGSQLTTGQRSAATQGMRDLLHAQYKNYNQNYQKTTRRNDFEDMFPVEGFSKEAPAAAAATASSGWGAAVAK